MADDPVTGQQLLQELHDLERRLESRFYTATGEMRGYMVGRIECLERKMDDRFGALEERFVALEKVVMQSLNGNGKHPTQG